MRSMLRRMLHRAGPQVSEAGNGAEGIDSYERDPPDLVITDILMPKKEGIETIIALHRADPDLPIIAISGGGRSYESMPSAPLPAGAGQRRSVMVRSPTTGTCTQDH